MTIVADKYLKRRLAKAQGYTEAQVVQLDDGTYWSVQSSRGGWYTVSILFKDNKLIRAWCGCPDYGETHLRDDTRDVPFCGHIGAASLAAITRSTSCYYVSHKESL